MDIVKKYNADKYVRNCRQTGYREPGKNYNYCRSRAGKRTNNL